MSLSHPGISTLCCFEVCSTVLIQPLQSVHFVQVFQSDLSYDCLLYPFVYVCGLYAGFQHVMLIISLIQLMDFISCSHV